MVGHLSMYIQTKTMPQSLIPTRGAACRREPLERARSNRRASRWTGSGRRHAGRVSQKRKPPLRAGRAGGGRVAHGGASSGVPGSQGMPQKRTFPGSLWKRYRRRPGNGVFWAAWFQNPNFAGAAPCASPGSFKGFMRTMPPGRWGAAMEVSFLIKRPCRGGVAPPAKPPHRSGEGDRLRWWGTSPCTFKQKRCHNR